MKADLKKLQQNLEITFHNLSLLELAFTHSSYANENRLSLTQDNERLEFLGDSVLSLFVSEYLYHRYPERSEGELTKMRASIVCEPTLVKFAEQLSFAQYIRLGRGEELSGGRNRPALLADVFESFIGALFLDQGIDVVKRFLIQFIFPQLSSSTQFQMMDYKTILQEYVQNHGLGILEYRIMDEKGPSHDREFEAAVFISDVLHGIGVGRSKKEAEQQAASKVLIEMKLISK
jgi:ribonuclease-3